MHLPPSWGMLDFIIYFCYSEACVEASCKLQLYSEPYGTTPSVPRALSKPPSVSLSPFLNNDAHRAAIQVYGRQWVSHESPPFFKVPTFFPLHPSRKPNPQQSANAVRPTKLPLHKTDNDRKDYTTDKAHALCASQGLLEKPTLLRRERPILAACPTKVWLMYSRGDKHGPCYPMPISSEMALPWPLAGAPYWEARWRKQRFCLLCFGWIPLRAQGPLDSPSEWYTPKCHLTLIEARLAIHLHLTLIWAPWAKG